MLLNLNPKKIVNIVSLAYICHMCGSHGRAYISAHRETGTFPDTPRTIVGSVLVGFAMGAFMMHQDALSALNKASSCINNHAMSRCDLNWHALFNSIVDARDSDFVPIAAVS